MIEHCLACGTSHDPDKQCPPSAFVLLKCSCGNESLMPADAMFMGLKGCMCGQCEKDTDWTVTQATEADLQKHWGLNPDGSKIGN